MRLRLPTKERAILYAKIIAGLGIAFFAIKLIRGQIRRKSILRDFGDFKTVTNDNRGNNGGKAGTTASFSPRPYAQDLYTAMKGGGTWEYMIWGALEPLNSEQREEVRVYFDANLGEGETLIQWFEGDLSGGDLTRAKGYFNQ